VGAEIEASDSRAQLGKKRSGSSSRCMVATIMNCYLLAGGASRAGCRVRVTRIAEP